MDEINPKNNISPTEVKDVKVDNAGSAGIVAGVINQNITLNPPVNIDQDVKATLRDVKEKLKHRYHEPDIPIVTKLHNMHLSISKFFVELEMHLHKNVDKNSPKQAMHIEDIFASEEDHEASRILISGSPGSGKSTLLMKLAHEWAKGSEFMSKFELALIVPLRSVSKSIESSVLDIATARTEKDRGLVLEVFRRYESNILLMLDGYDELQKELENSIISVIRGEIYPQMTVIITSRRGKFMLPESKKQPIFANHQFMNIMNIKEPTPESLCQKHIHICGISKDKQREFLELHLSATTSHKNVDSFSKAQDVIDSSGKQISESPLYLLLIATMISEISVTIPTNLTQLFKMTVAYLTNRQCRRLTNVEESLPLLVDSMFRVQRLHLSCLTNVFQHLGRYIFTDFCKTDFGLSEFGKALHLQMEKCLRTFPYQVPLYFHEDMLELFGKFALKLLSKGKLSFTESEFSQKFGKNSTLLELGLFVPNTYDAVSLESEKTYEPIHKSVFEFFTAYFLRTLFLKNELVEFKKILWTLKELWPQAGSDSLLFPFLAGLLGREMYVVFDLIRPMAFQYSHNFSALSDTLLECALSEELFEALHDFFPVQWVLPERPDFLGCDQVKILEGALNSGKVQVMEFYENVDYREIESAEVWRLQVELKDICNFKQLNLQSFKCNEIHCLINSNSLYLRNIRDRFCSEVKRCNAKHISITLPENEDLLSLLHQEISAGCWQDITIYNCKCNITNHSRHHLRYLTSMIKQEKIISLHTSIATKHIACSACNCSECILMSKELQDLIDAAGNSEVLRNFFIHNYTTSIYTLDISSMFCKKESWKWLWFWNVRIAWLKSHKSTHNIRIELLDLVTDLKDTDTAIENLLSHPIITLTCRSETFKKIMNMADIQSWVGLKSILELIIVLSSSEITNQFFRDIKRLTNLNLLVLWLTKPQQQMHYGTVAKEITKVLKSLHHPVFELWFPEQNLEFFKGVVVELERNCPAGGRNNGVENEKLVQELMLYINSTLDIHNYDEKEAEAVVQIISLLARLKIPLKQDVFNAIQIVCQDAFHIFLQHNKPLGIASLADIFPWNEGFVIRYDLYGSKHSDCHRARNELKFYSVYPRFTVSWKCKQKQDKVHRDQQHQLDY